ncbi:hypothetical protein DAEQUDRAFT_727875 [Daedalea quercina L-15889]|uniref:Zinc-finger domain-containing protein n=1 Tax=Daedalea quercina L-15889 TaxID=1314783 RepID=A0A165PQL5_9APHY|nr:hypothetical protein DAEQUDRAFT_727875 [Daedalea quercina L-15889]
MAYSSLANWDGSQASSPQQPSPSHPPRGDSPHSPPTRPPAQSGASTAPASAGYARRPDDRTGSTASSAMPPPSLTQGRRPAPHSSGSEAAVASMLSMYGSDSEVEPIEAGPAQVDARITGGKIADMGRATTSPTLSFRPNSRSPRSLPATQLPSNPTTFKPRPGNSPSVGAEEMQQSHQDTKSNQVTGAAFSTVPSTATPRPASVPTSPLISSPRASTAGPSRPAQNIPASHALDEAAGGRQSVILTQGADADMLDLTAESHDTRSDSGSSRSRRRAIPRSTMAAMLHTLGAQPSSVSSDEPGMWRSGPPPPLLGEPGSSNVSPSTFFTFRALDSAGSSTSSHGIMGLLLDLSTPGLSSRESTAPPPRKQQKTMHISSAKSSWKGFPSVFSVPAALGPSRLPNHPTIAREQPFYIFVPPLPRGASRDDYVKVFEASEEIEVIEEIEAQKASPKRKARRRAEKKITETAAFSVALATPPLPAQTALPELPSTPPPLDAQPDYAPAFPSSIPADGFAPLEIEEVKVDSIAPPVTLLSLCAALRNIAPGSAQSAAWWRQREQEEDEVMRRYREEVDREKAQLIWEWGAGPSSVTTTAALSGMPVSASKASASSSRMPPSPSKVPGSSSRVPATPSKAYAKRPTSTPKVPSASTRKPAAPAKVPASSKTSAPLSKTSGPSSSVRAKRKAKAKPSTPRAAASSSQRDFQHALQPPPPDNMTQQIVQAPPPVPPPPPLPLDRLPRLSFASAPMPPPASLYAQQCSEYALRPSPPPSSLDSSQHSSLMPRPSTPQAAASYDLQHRQYVPVLLRESPPPRVLSMTRPFTYGETSQSNLLNDGFLRAHTSMHVDAGQSQQQMLSPMHSPIARAEPAPPHEFTMSLLAPEQENAMAGMSFQEHGGDMGFGVPEHGPFATINPALLGGGFEPEPELERPTSPSERNVTSPEPSAPMLERTHSPFELVRSRSSEPSSERTLAVTEDHSDYDEKTEGKGKGKGRGKGKGKGKEKPKSKPSGRVKGVEEFDGVDEGIDVEDTGIVQEEMSFCHHCRRTTTHPKMRCTMIKPNGEACGKRFCLNCIFKKYEQIKFDMFVTIFQCPYCEGTCTCTQCCAKRGETYVSMPRGQVVLLKEGRTPTYIVDSVRRKRTTISKVVAMPTTRRRRQASPASVPPQTKSPSPQPLPENRADQLMSGELWAARVYGVDGTLIGGAYVNSDERSVVLKPYPAAAGPSLSTTQQRPKKRTFIGRPDPSWGLGSRVKGVNHPRIPKGARAYIGDKSFLDWERVSESGSDVEDLQRDCFDGPLTPTSSDLELDDEGEKQSPRKSLSPADLAFTLAKLLHVQEQDAGSNENAEQ